jgi:hypothetical protein
MSNRRSSSRADRFPWPLAVGPAIVVVASIVTMAIAATHDDGLVASDYYKLGLTINRRLAATPEKAHDVAATVAIARDGGVRVRLDAEARTVAMSLRPVRAHAPVAVALQRTGAGEWTGAAGAIAPGRLIVALEADGVSLPVTLVEALPATVRVHGDLPSR